jgi:hypothetical protein
MTLEPEDLRVHGGKRRYYKNLLKQKHTQYIEKGGERIAEEAINNPYLAIRPRRISRSSNVEIGTWVIHFTNILNSTGQQVAYEIECSNQLEVISPSLK